MAHRFAIPIALLLFAPLLAVSFAPAPPERKRTDWAMFGGTPARNMVNLTDRVNIDNFIPEQGTGVLWTAALGSRSYGGPIIAGGKVFVGTNNEQPRNPRDSKKAADGEVEPIDRGILMCFDERTGQFLWQAVHDKLPGGVVNDWPKEGVASAPAVEGKRVYYVSNRAEVVCVDARGFADGNQGMQNEQYATKTDADILWSFDMMKQLKVFPHNLAACPPLIVGDILFVVTANGVDEGHINIPFPDAPSFIALDKNSGKLLCKRNDPGKNIMHGQWAAPSYGVFEGVRQVIFPGGDGWLYSFVPETGELIWKFDCNPKDAVYELGGTGTRNDFVNCAPAIYDGRIYIGVGQDPEHSTGIAYFFCIAPKKASKGDVSKTLIDGRKAVAPGMAGPGQPINERANPNSIEVWRYGGEESRQWAVRDFKFGRTMSNACIVDDVVYISELTGYLHCLDAKTGKHFWQFDTKASIWGSPYYCDEKIFLGDDNGDLYIFKHQNTHEVYDELAPTQNIPIGVANRRTARTLMNIVRKQVEQQYLLRKVELDGPIRATPAVANGVLYVMTEKTLYAIGKP